MVFAVKIAFFPPERAVKEADESMGYNDLRAFIEELDRHGELIRIDAPVSTDLEIAEITDRVSKATDGSNKALLFTNVKGYDIPVLINAFGSDEADLSGIRN